ncbi:uncharacterized protein LOC127752111 isoform X1 [Frankliniella occidentalis]|uniref:Uncharacterized protein LOC127752111 isoform X1 n=1 Tax=Frankliniella occidentalis TaxID=133901 RepID=A0A9C6XB66_FRAOC|nr:uncharacterized protein LOC127752111 isoform X1 [Frankliniella occidentalis]
MVLPTAGAGAAVARRGAVASADLCLSTVVALAAVTAVVVVGSLVAFVRKSGGLGGGKRESASVDGSTKHTHYPAVDPVLTSDDSDEERSSSTRRSSERFCDSEVEVDQVSWVDSAGSQARRAWQRYLRDGRTDPALARRLLDGAYDALPPLPAGATASRRQRSRHRAAVRFFGLRSQRVRRHMARVARHQFRTPRSGPHRPEGDERASGHRRRKALPGDAGRARRVLQRVRELPGREAAAPHLQRHSPRPQARLRSRGDLHGRGLVGHGGPLRAPHRDVCCSRRRRVPPAVRRLRRGPNGEQLREELGDLQTHRP